MGLFNRHRKNEEDKANQKVNQIENTELKENLLDTALSVLVNQNLMTFEDFKGIRADFGYLLMIENHGLEALFKITKNEKVYYFAAQQGNLMLVTIDEQQFQSTTEYMVDTHLNGDKENAGTTMVLN